MVGSGMIGLPTPFRKCRIVDENGNDVERGQIGELWISGRGLMSGYFNRPDAEEKAWAGKWFRSGDLFVQDEAGYYKIVGRIKDVIRRSGENISATEVEYVVSAMPQVEDVAAVPVADQHRGEEINLIVVLCQGQSPDSVTPDLIGKHCSERLAAFKVPRYITYVASLPKTPSGKTSKADMAKASFPSADKTYDLVRRCWM